LRALAIVFASLGLAVLVVPAHAGHVRTSHRSVAQIIRHAFPDDQRRALCVAGYESTGTPGHFDATASNAGSDGLFELNGAVWDPARNPRAAAIVGHVSWRRIFEPAYNAMVARRIYVYDRRHRADHDGWHQWSTRGLCGA
jgi:hypothetical protein